MSKLSQYDNRANAQSLEEKALQRAKDALNAQGVTFPLYDSKRSVEANYNALTDYRMKEVELYKQFLNEPSGPRPLVLDNVSKPKQQVRKPYKDWYD